MKFEMTEMDKRRYAYEKAIEAYWKHVDRYHTWMNYYSLFNGAFVCGILYLFDLQQLGLNRMVMFFI